MAASWRGKVGGLENWSAVHSDGHELFAGLAGTRKHAVEAVLRRPPGRGEYVTIMGSVSGSWRVGPRGGVRREPGA